MTIYGATVAPLVFWQPVVGDVDAAREGHLAVAHQRFTVVPADQGPKMGSPDTVGVVGNGLHALPPHVFEEAGGSVAAADGIVEKSNLDASLCRL